MAPEQKEGRDADARADLYSCGIVLYEMLTGERPQGGDLPSLLRAEVPARLDDVFKRCYTRLERRFASAEEMLEALEPVFDTPAAPPPPPVSPKTGRCAAGLCPSCGIRVRPDDQFCIKCGRQLVESVPRCPACKAYVHRNDQFCIFCGHDLRVMAD
jgi:serine/threonine protein kinase